MNNKFTLVSNPFTLPFEEIMILTSYINDYDGYIGGIDGSERVCVPEDGKLFRGKHLTVVSYEYDTEDFDLSLSSNGWLVFQDSRTKIREYLFQIYKVLRSRGKQFQFHRPSFEDYSDNLRIGYIKSDEPTIIKNTIHYSQEERGIGSIFSGGGRSTEYLTVLPIPPHITTFDIICHVLTLECGKEHIKYIITSNNYSYRFNTRGYIESCSAPIIEFLHTEYDCLLIEGSPDDDHMDVIYKQLATCMKIPQLREIATCDYKNVRSAMSDMSHTSVWLFVFDFMNYKMDTPILSGSHLYNSVKSVKSECMFKKIRIEL